MNNRLFLYSIKDTMQQETIISFSGNGQKLVIKNIPSLEETKTICALIQKTDSTEKIVTKCLHWAAIFATLIIFCIPDIPYVAAYALFLLTMFFLDAVTEKTYAGKYIAAILTMGKHMFRIQAKHRTDNKETAIVAKYCSDIACKKHIHPSCCMAAYKRLINVMAYATLISETAGMSDDQRKQAGILVNGKTMTIQHGTDHAYKLEFLHQKRDTHTETPCSLCEITLDSMTVRYTA